MKRYIQIIRHILPAVIISTGFFFFSSGQSFAQEGVLPPMQKSLDEVMTQAGVSLVFLAGIILAILVLIAYRMKHTGEQAKKVLFFSISGIILATTLFLIFSTVYVNSQSSSKGPVHWHADIEVWACGEEREFKDPKGWSNKIGTATFHEHNDKRIHVEGVVMQPHDVALGNFFRVIGGELSKTTLTVPEETGSATFVNGGVCPTGESAEVQVFVYTVTGDTYAQQKLQHPETYIMSPHGTIPPGDCVIVEYDVPKSRTDKLCKSYHVAEQIGKIRKEEL